MYVTVEFHNSQIRITEMLNEMNNPHVINIIYKLSLLPDAFIGAACCCVVIVYCMVCTGIDYRLKNLHRPSSNLFCFWYVANLILCYFILFVIIFIWRLLSTLDRMYCLMFLNIVFLNRHSGILKRYLYFVTYMGACFSRLNIS